MRYVASTMIDVAMTNVITPDWRMPPPGRNLALLISH